MSLKCEAREARRKITKNHPAFSMVIHDLAHVSAPPLSEICKNAQQLCNFIALSKYKIILR